MSETELKTICDNCKANNPDDTHCLHVVRWSKPSDKKTKEEAFWHFNDNLSQFSEGNPQDHFNGGWQACLENEGSAIEECIDFFEVEIPKLKEIERLTQGFSGQHVATGRLLETYRIFERLQSIRDKYKEGK